MSLLLLTSESVLSNRSISLKLCPPYQNLCVSVVLRSNFLENSLFWQNLSQVLPLYQTPLYRDLHDSPVEMNARATHGLKHLEV